MALVMDGGGKEERGNWSGRICRSWRGSEWESLARKIAEMPASARKFAVSPWIFKFSCQRMARRLKAMEWDELIKAAWQARELAYAPYSKFPVGAALLAADGRVFVGCNVENLSYGLTNCAERVAIGAAVAAGAREFLAVAVVAETGVPISPCGACRQVLAEFGVPLVLLANRASRLEFRLEELLPRATAGILDRGERL